MSKQNNHSDKTKSTVSKPQTEMPVSEKDEVKQAEEKLKKNVKNKKKL